MSINHLARRLYTPETVHHRYDVDVRFAEGSQLDLAKRVAVATLPLLSLYRPVGAVFSVGMNGVRFVSHCAKVLSCQGSKTDVFLAMGAAASLAVSCFQSTTGLFISTLSDFSYSLSQLEGAQALSSFLYLSFMVTGSLELILFSVFVQGMISLYEAREEFGKGRYIEAFCKALLGCAKGYQVHQYRKLIQQRDALFSLKKYQQLIVRAKRAKEASSLQNHPLADLDAVLKTDRVKFSVQDNEYDFGAYLHGYGKGAVKGNNLHIERVQHEGKNLLQLDFKLNHVHRQELQKTLKELSLFDPKELEMIFRLTGATGTGISVDREGSMNRLLDFCYSDSKEVPEYVVRMPGVGRVTVGASTTHYGQLQELPNLYDRVHVQVEEGKSLYEMRELLTFLDLDQALSPSTKEDTERLKLGHLFHALFPKEAFSLERSKEFFTLSVDALKERMMQLAPKMKEAYDTYFHRMKPAEVLPGKMRYQIEGLSDAVRAKGIDYLTSAVTGGDESLFSRVSSMLSIGMCSSELRDQARIDKEGLSRGWDYMSGGADSVFTQLFSKQGLPSVYRSRVKMLISLKALELGSYQSNWDSFGTRRVDWWARYDERPNILELADNAKSFCLHEVMLKERVDPSYFEGIQVADQSTREGLLSHLRQEGLIKKNGAGEETILGHLVSQFIRIGS